MPARDFSRRYSLFYACLFLGAGVQLPFLPLWLAHKGLDASAIGLVLAAQLASRAVGAPLGALAADFFGNGRMVMIVCASLGFGLTALLAFAAGFAMIFTLALLSAVVLAPVFPLGDAAAVDGSARHGVDYGRVRLWGSLSFITGSLGAGAVLQFVSIAFAVPVMAVGQAVLALACFALPVERRPGGRGPRISLSSLKPFLSGPFLLLASAASLGQASHAVLYGFGALHWDHAGYQKASIALFWAVSIAFEVLFFACSRHATALFGSTGLIILGSGIGLVRWPLMAFDAPLALIFATQAMHALSFAALHLGTLVHIQEKAPPALRNTAQGLNAAIISGIAMSLAMWAAGPLFEAFGAGAYLAMAAMSALAFAAALLLRLK